MAETSNVITGAIAGLAALLGVFATWQSTTNTAKIEANRVELERTQQDAEYRLAVFQRVADAIEKAKDNPQQLRAAVLLVNTLPDETDPKVQSLKQQLLVILVEGGVAAGGEAAEAVDAIRDQTSDAPDATTVKKIDAPAAETIAPPATTAPPSSGLARNVTAPEVREFAQRVRMRAPGAWNVDVFYCEGAAQNQAHAALFNATLATEALKQHTAATAGPEIDLPLGQVRLRPLSVESYKRIGYDKPSDFLRAEPSEVEAATKMAAWGQSRGAAPLAIVGSNQPTPYYIAAYYCGATR